MKEIRNQQELYVHYGLQRSTRVCAYDRAGLGSSDPAPGTRTAARIADDLGRALRHLGIGGPLVVVGHGYGGLYARQFAAAHPGGVAGLVLVDSMSPTFIEEVAPLLTPKERDDLEAGFRDDPEFQGARDSFAQVAATGTLGDLPLVVVARDPAAGSLRPDAEALWRSHQQAQAELSTRGRLVEAAGTGYDIPLDRPELVVDAIRRVLDQIR